MIILTHFTLSNLARKKQSQIINNNIIISDEHIGLVPDLYLSRETERRTEDTSVRVESNEPKTIEELEQVIFDVDGRLYNNYFLYKPEGDNLLSHQSPTIIPLSEGDSWIVYSLAELPEARRIRIEWVKKRERLSHWPYYQLFLEPQPDRVTAPIKRRIYYEKYPSE